VKSAAGVNSSAMPVKWRDSSVSLMRLAPRAGSCNSATPPRTAVSTTK